MAETTVKVRLGIDADVTAAKRAISSLEASLTNLHKAQASRGFEDFGLNEAVQNAKVLESSLNRAFNQDTNKLDLSVLNKNLRDAGTSINEISSQFLKAGSAGQQAFMSLATAVAHTEVPLKKTNQLVQSFARTLKNTVQYQISASMFQAVSGAISDAISYTKTLNGSLNDIRIVTGQSAAEMAKFAQAANASAQRLSTTTNNYAKASLIFYQQGLSDAEVKKRTDAVIKMANVTKENMADVSSYMTAVWNNFDDGSKSLEHYADVMTALGAATASSTKEIAAGLEKFASIGKTIGLSYDYATSALATIVSKTRQSADTVGTGLRTIFSRLQGLSLGETLEDGVDLNKYSSALKTVGVNILDATGNMKNMDTILESLAGKWENLSNAQKTALAQTVGGVRQYTTLISLMDNWDSMKQNLNTAKGADGALGKQQAIFAESWEAASQRSKAAVEELYQTLLNDKGFIKMIDGLTAATKAVTALAKGFGGLPGILSTIGMISTKVFSQQMTSSISNNLLKLNTWAGQFEGKNTLGKIGSGVKAVFTGKTKSYEQVNASKEMANTQEGYKRTMAELEASGKKDSSEYYAVEAASKLLAEKQKLLATESTLSAAEKARSQAAITAMAEEQAAVLALKQEKEALAKVEKQSATAGIKGVIRAGTAQTGTRSDGSTFVRSNDAAANWILSRAQGYNASSGVQGLVDLRQKRSDIAYNTTMAAKYTSALGQLKPGDTAGREKIMASMNKTFGDGTVTKIEGIDKALQKIISTANTAEKEIQDVINGAKGADLEAGNALEDYVDGGRDHGESRGMIDWEHAVRTRQIPTNAATPQDQEALRRLREEQRRAQADKIAGGMQKASQAVMSFTSGLSQASTLMATLGDESASTAQKITSSMSVASSAVTAFATGGILGGVAYLAGFALTAGLDAIDKAYRAEEIAADQAQADAEALQENYRTLQESYDNLLSTFDSYKDGSQTLESLITGTDEWKEALIQANEAALQLINNLGLVEGQDYTIGTNGEITFTKEGQNRIDQAQSDKLQETLTAQSAANLAQAEAASARARADLDAAAKSNDKGRWATAAGLAATGAGLGAWGGTALGTAVPVIGNVIGGVAGAILGGVGGLLGGLFAYDSIKEQTNKAEKDKVDAIVKKFEGSNGTMTDSDLKELINKQFTGESESYKKSILKVVKSTVEANKQLNDAMKLAAQNVLNANEIYNSITNEDAQADVSARASKIYANAANAAGDTFDSTTDAETRKQWAQEYADILTAGKQGVDIKYNDDGSFTYNYIGDDGHVTEDFKVTESMLRTWYKSSQGDAAVNAQVEDLSEVYTDLREGNIKGISKSSQNAIASMSARDNLNDMTGSQIKDFSVADLEALTQDQLTALGFVDLADAKAKGGKMRKAYVEEWNALAAEHKASGFYGNYEGTGDLSLFESMSLNAFKNFDNIVNELEKGPIAEIGKKLNLGIEKAFEDANVSEEDRTALLDQISQIDWSDYDAFEQFKTVFEGMGYSIDTASGEWDEFITQMRQASGAIPDFTSLKNNLASMAKITKDLKLGDIVSEEDYDTLVKINDAYADLFILQADGSRKFIGDADAMREATKEMALEQKELLDSYKAVADIEDVVKFNWDNVKGESTAEDFNKLYADNEALQTMLTNAGYTKEIIDEIFKEAANGDTTRLEAMFDLVQKATDPAQMAVATQELEEMIASTATSVEELQSMLANNTISQETYSKSLIALASGYEYCAEAIKKYQDALATGDKDLIKDAEESLAVVIELEKEASKYEDAFSHALSGKSSVSVKDLMALKEISPELYSGYSTMSEDEWYRASYEAYSQWLETRIAGYSEDSAAYKVLMAEKTQLDTKYNQHLAEIAEKAAKAQQAALEEYIDTIQEAIDELSSLDLSGKIGSFSFAELESFRQAIEAAGLDYDAFMEKISPKNHATNKDAILALADAQTQLELLGHTAKIEQLQNAQNVISPTVRANIEPPLENNGDAVGVTTVDGITTVSVNPINYGLFFNEDGTLIEKYGNANYRFYLKPPTGTGGGVTVSGDVITGLEPLEGEAGYIASIVQNGNDAKVTVSKNGITVTDAYGKANIKVTELNDELTTVDITSAGISLAEATGTGKITVADLVGNNTTVTVNGTDVKIKDANGKGTITADLADGNGISVDENNAVTIKDATGKGSITADLDDGHGFNVVGDKVTIENATGTGTITADLADGHGFDISGDTVTINPAQSGGGSIVADLSGKGFTVEGTLVKINTATGAGTITADLASGGDFTVTEGAFVYNGTKPIKGEGAFTATVSLSENAEQTNVSVGKDGIISLVNNSIGLSLTLNPDDGKTTGVQVLNDGTIALHGLDSVNKEVLMSLGIDPNSAFKFENGVLTLPPFELPTLTQTIELQYLEKRDTTLVKELNTLQSIVEGRNKGLITGSGVNNKTGALIANDSYTRFYGDADTGWAARLVDAGSIDAFMNSSIMYNGRTNRQDFLAHANSALTEASGVIDLSGVGEDAELTRQFLQSDMWQTARLMASIGDEAGIDLYDMFVGGYTDKNNVFHSQDDAYQEFIGQFGQMMGLIGVDNWTNEDKILGQDIIGRFIQNGDYENGLEWLFSLLPENATEADLENLILNTLGYESLDDFFKVWDVDAFETVTDRRGFRFSASGNLGRAHRYANRMDHYGVLPSIDFTQEGLDYTAIYEEYYADALEALDRANPADVRAGSDWLANSLAGAQSDDLQKIATEHLREAFGDPSTWTEDIFNDSDFNKILERIFVLFKSENPQLQALGQYLWQGLAAGIYDESGNLIGAVGENAAAIIETISSAWGIASPSKVARQLGRYFMQGLNLGFSDIKVNIGPLSKTIIEAVQRDLDVTAPIVSNMVKTGLGGAFTFAEWGDNFTLTNEDGTLKDLAGDSFTQIRGYVVNAVNSILGTEYASWEEVIAAYGNGENLEAALKAKDSNASLSGIITQAKANETTAANKAWLDKSGYKFAQYKDGENAGKWYVAHDGDILEDFGVKDSEADMMQAVLENEAYIKEMQNGVAKYMDGEFWSDKTLNLMEKAVYNTIAKEALGKLGATSFEQYLANGGSVEEMFKQIDAAYNNHVTELSGDVSKSWASIKDNYIKVIQDCMKEDAKAAEETVTRWTSAWEAIGEIRKAILSGDIEDTSISEILKDETKRENYIRSLMGNGSYYQNGVFDFNNMYAHLIGHNQADLNKVRLGSYADSGLNKVDNIQFLNTGADGRVINTTLGQYMTNHRTQTIATNAGYLADSEYVGQLTGNHLFTPLYGVGTNVSNIYSHMADFQAWATTNNKEYKTSAEMEAAFLEWGQTNGLFTKDQALSFQTGEGHLDKFVSYFNMMNSLINEGLLIAGENGQSYTWKDGTPLTGEVLATADYNATYGNRTTQQWQTEYENANIAAMMAQTGYYNDYVTQMQDEFDTRSKVLEDKQKLVQKALNGEELNTSEQAELDKIMAEGGYSTLEEANVGLASEMDACAAAAARFAKALSLGYVPDGNGNFVKTTAKSAGFTGSYETEEAAKAALGDNNGVWTQDAEGNWFMQRAVQTGEGENATWQIETVTLDTETMTVDSPQYVALSPEKTDNTEAAQLVNAQAAGFASLQEQNDYIKMMVNAGEDTTNYSDGGMLSAEDIMNQSTVDGIDTLEKAVDLQREYANQLALMEQGLTELNSSGKEWIKTLKSQKASMIDQTKALNNLRKSYQKILGLTDEQMGLLGDDFLKDEKNLDLVTKAATKAGKEGAEALDELQTNAALAVITTAKLAETADTADEVTAKFGKMAEAASGFKFNAGDIVTGADEAFATLDSLYGSIVALGGGTEESMATAAAAIEALGYIPCPIELETIEMTAEELKKYVTVDNKQAYDADGNPITVSDVNEMIETGAKSYSIQVPVGTGASMGKTATAGTGGTGRGYKKKAEKTGGGGGGGGGGGSRRRYLAKAKPEDHKERYHEINNALDEVTDALERLNKQQDRAWGAERLKSMQAESEELKKQRDLIRKKTEEAQNYLKQDLADAAQYGWTFDEENNVSNYEDNWNKLLDVYNSKIAEYNAMSAEQQEALEKDVTEANENGKTEYINPDTGVAFGSYEEYLKYHYLDEPTAALEQVEETMDELEQLGIDYDDVLNSLYDNFIEQVQTKWDTANEIADANIEYLEHKISRLEDNAYKAAETIGLMSDKMDYTQDKFNAATIALDDLLKGYDSAWSAEAIMAGQVTAEDLAGAGMDANAVEMVQSIMSELMNLEQEMTDTLIESFESMTEAFDEFNEDLDRYISTIEHAQSITSTYRNIIDLTGKSMSGFSTELLKAFNSATIDQAKANMKSNKTKYDTVQAEYDEAYQQYLNAQTLHAQGKLNDAALKAAKEAFEATQDNLNEAQEAYVASWEAALQAVADAYTSTMEGVMDEISKNLTNGLAGGLDALQERMDRMKTKDSNYVDDYEKIYQLTKLTRDLETQIDKTSNVRAQKELLKFQKEINGILQSDKKLSEYDIDYLQKKYDLKLAEIALEDAQNAKSQVTMRRDSEGNYNYVYTADENAVAEAEAEYATKLYEMQKANDEYITSLSDSIVSLKVEMRDALLALDPSQFASEEEFNAAVEELIAFYTEQMSYHQEQLETVLGNNKDLYEKDMVWYNKYANYKMADAASFIDSWNETLLAQATGFETMDELFETFFSQAEVAQSESVTAYRNYVDAINAINAEAGHPTETLAQSLTEDIEAMTDQAEQAATDMKEHAETIVGEITSIGQAIEEMANKFGVEIVNMAKQTDLLVAALTDMLEIMGRAGDIELEEGLLADIEARRQAREQEYASQSFDTGGYTGSWGPEGKLAWLHQKELVLNAADTENILASVGILRQIANTIDLNALTSAGGFISLMSSGISGNRETLQQEVHIEASFPAVTDKNQIEDAFTDLVNLAAQYANRK